MDCSEEPNTTFDRRSQPRVHRNGVCQRADQMNSRFRYQERPSCTASEIVRARQTPFSVDARWERAVEGVFGSSLQSILVPTLKTPFAPPPG